MISITFTDPTNFIGTDSVSARINHRQMLVLLERILFQALALSSDYPELNGHVGGVFAFSFYQHCEVKAKVFRKEVSEANLKPQLRIEYESEVFKNLCKLGESASKHFDGAIRCVNESGVRLFSFCGLPGDWNKILMLVLAMKMKFVDHESDLYKKIELISEKRLKDLLRACTNIRL